MGFDPDNVENVMIKFGDRSGNYTEEEERAIQEYYDLIDNDEEMLPFRKYAQKNYVIVGLRAWNLDAKKHYKSVKAFHYHAVNTFSDLFAQMEPMNLKPIIQQKLLRVVKRHVDVGPAIVVFRVKNWNPVLTSLEQLALTATLYLHTISKMSPEIQRQGIIIISDGSGFKLAHARQGSLDLIYKFRHLAEISPPVCKGMVVVNSISLFEKTYKMFRWLLPEDIKKLVHITKNDMSPIVKLSSPDRLPVEFGGTMPDDEAYMEGIEEEVLKDPELFELIKHIQGEFLKNVGLKKGKKSSNI